jgi:hypothetical protein
MLERSFADHAALIRVGFERASLLAERLDLAPQLIDRHPAMSRAASSAW